MSELIRNPIESAISELCDKITALESKLAEMKGWEKACKNESNSRSKLQKLAVDYGDKLSVAEDNIDKLKIKSAQAYQVIGALGGVDDPEVIRALDYFSDTSAYNELFLPFTPPEDKP